MVELTRPQVDELAGTSESNLLSIDLVRDQMTISHAHDGVVREILEGTTQGFDRVETLIGWRNRVSHRNLPR